ncbi:glycosyltransferase family 2 protein [Candidatus Bathyarchaeota archaeon]|nr:glycosyltransferase family 2 protein [Candidatus Bathyarchaeota archaeon]
MSRRFKTALATLLISPFLLAYLMWRWLPLVVDYIIRYFLCYKPAFQQASWLWHAVLAFFSGWYIFSAIAVGGVFLAASWVYNRRKATIPDKRTSPAVSFIVPAYNEEKTISKCIASLFKCAANYPGYTEIIVVDDGSTDNTRRVAEATFKMNWERWPYIKAKIISHKKRLGKAAAIKTGVKKAFGALIATVDADTWWEPDTLRHLVDRMVADKLDAVTGFIHPSDGNGDTNLYVILQQLEYSQGLGIYRCAQALGNSILVIPGPIGLYRADVLKKILNEINLKSVTEDLEITLDMQKRGYKIGYNSKARSTTIAPHSFKILWGQRKRWFIGGLHNFLGIHKRMLFKRRWLALILWYSLIMGYGGALIELIAAFSLPILYWFAPDKIYFLYNLILYSLIVFLIGVFQHAVALKFSYNSYNHRKLLLYTPLYPLLRYINIFARLTCLIQYLAGKRGRWEEKERPIIQA